MNLLETFQQFNQKVPVMDIWSQRREQAAQSIEKIGWPSRRQEDWKYTSLQSFKDLKFNVNPELLNVGVSSDFQKYEGNLLPGFLHIVFVDGVLQKLPQEIPGLKMTELRQALSIKSGPWTKWMGRWEVELGKLRTKKGFTEQVSEAFLDSGICLEVQAQQKLPMPVQIAFINTGSASANFSSTQVWVDIGEASGSDLVMTSMGNQLQLNQTQIWLRPNSKTSFLKWSDLSNEHSDFQRIEVQQEAGSEFHSWSVGMGGKVQRNELEIYIKGEQATTKAWGVSLVAGQQVLDHHTLIDHVHGGSQSEQLYKGILSDESRLVFDGQVKIRKGADKASSEQLNKNLILSGTAEVDSKPQLQVLADDVKATHGSATGQMSQDEIFYFQSRGIGEQEARRLLAMGFVDDLVDLHPLVAVKQFIKARLKSSFDQSWEKLK